MSATRLKPSIMEKAASTVKLEEEAREVIAEAKALADAKAAAKERARIEEERQSAAVRARAEARCKARVEEEARIEAAGASAWFYLVDGEQRGSVTLAEMKELVSDSSVEPPIHLVWTEGMDSWKPFYDVRKLCEPSAADESAITPSVNAPTDAHPRQDTVAELPEVAAARAAEAARLASLAKAENEMRVRDAKDARRNASERASRNLTPRQTHVSAQSRTDAGLTDAAIADAAKLAEADLARIRAETEAKLVAAEEAMKKAEAKAAAETELRLAAEGEAEREKQLRAATEARAAEETRIATEARAKAETEARAKALVEAEAGAKILAAEKARASAEIKAANETRTAAMAIARVEAEERARALAAAELEAKVLAAEQARSAAEAMASEEAHRRTDAEARVARETRLRVAAETDAAGKEKAVADLKAETEAMAAKNAAAVASAAAAREEARISSIAGHELKAAEDARALAEKRAVAEASLRAAAELKAASEAERRAEAESRAIREEELRKTTEENAALEARRLATLTEAKARDEAADPINRLAISDLSPAATPPARIRTRPGKKTKTSFQRRRVKTKPPTPATPTKSRPKKKRSANTWFYTSEGERLGPVSFEDLRTMATNGTLDPRLDMAWKEGMEEWKPAGRIDGLFERRNVSADSVEPAKDLRHPGISAAARIGGIASYYKGMVWPGTKRRGMILAAIVFPFVWHLALGAAAPRISTLLGVTLATDFLTVAAFAPVLLFVHLGMRRLVNLGMSRLWCLAAFAPVVNLWIGYRCFACPAGYSHHHQMDTPGKTLAAIYWLAIFSAIAFLAMASDFPAGSSFRDSILSMIGVN